MRETCTHPVTFHVSVKLRCNCTPVSWGRTLEKGTSMSQKEDINPFDPTGMFKNMREAGMDAWSKMMVQLVNSEGYAKANSAMMDAWLSSSAPFRKAVESTMTQVLTQLNMPTRSDVTSLG